MAQLASATSAVRAILDGTIMQAFSLKDANVSLKDSNEAKRTSLSGLLERLRKGTEVVRLLTIENKALEANIAAMSTEVDECTAKAKTVGQTFKNARELNASLRSEHEQLLQQVEKLRSEKDVVQREDLSLKTSLTEQQAVLAGLRTEIETLQHEIGALHSSSGGLRMSIEQCKRYESDHVRGSAELKERVQALRTELARLERDKEEAISRREAALAALHSEQARESSLQDAKALAEREHASALAQAQAYEKESAVQQAAVVQATAELDAARAKAQAQRHSADEARKLLRALQSQRTLLTESSSRAQEELSAIAGEYSKVKQEVEALHKQIQDAKKAVQMAASTKEDRLKAVQSLRGQRQLLEQRAASGVQGSSSSSTPGMPTGYRPEMEDEEEDMSLGALRAAAAAASAKASAPPSAKSSKPAVAMAEVAVQTDCEPAEPLPPPSHEAPPVAGPPAAATMPMPAAVGGPKAGSPALMDPIPAPIKADSIPVPLPAQRLGKATAGKQVAAGSPGEEAAKPAVPATVRGRSTTVQAARGSKSGGKRSRSSLSVSVEPKTGTGRAHAGEVQGGKKHASSTAVQAVQESEPSAAAPTTVRKVKQQGKGKGSARAQAVTPSTTKDNAPIAAKTPMAVPPGADPADNDDDDDDDLFGSMALLTVPGVRVLGSTTGHPGRSGQAHTTAMASAAGKASRSKARAAPATVAAGLLPKRAPSLPASMVSDGSSPAPVAVLFNPGTDWLFEELA